VEQAAVRESKSSLTTLRHTPPPLDFSTPANVVKAVTEGERLTYGHLFNPSFATEISLVDPLPHQRIAIYRHMLTQARLRFLLADDAGAGKTIMAGLYIREMLARRLIRRVLIVPPAGLIGNWERELRVLFNLHSRIVVGADARDENPFAGPRSDLVIVSVDTLSGPRMFARLREPSTIPYDLVIFDEAHKLSADRELDYRIRKTERYQLAEALAGAPIEEERWSLPWSAHHLLLLTATPHMGKDTPYYFLWRLVEPEVLSTEDAFNHYPPEERALHFLRRTKEEMVYFNGSPIYPKRVSDTLSYDLTQGEVSEQRLYDETTKYIQTFYNKARMLNRSAATFAMSVFQRRLASSTWALLRSFERRLAKLEAIIAALERGEYSMEDIVARQRRLGEGAFDKLTGDEEEAGAESEENELDEDKLLAGIVATNLVELQAERGQVFELLDLAKAVYALGEESKFDELHKLIQDPRYKDEKIIIFTEHKDTLDFLVRKLEGKGYAEKVARIHGVMDYKEREREVDFFRRPVEEGGAQYLVGTDAAGEGINLQFCWLMVNYDVPWNPARLEQRMGRIHRYGQAHDPVVILNLVAASTREGRVLKTLLEKLERIRKELGSDKVFDVVGRLFEGVSLRDYMEQAVTEEGAQAVVHKLDSQLTKDRVEALRKEERLLYGEGGDVASVLADERRRLQQESYRRLLPAYVRRFLENALPLLDLGVDGDLDGVFALKALRATGLDPFWDVLDTYPSDLQERFTLHRPKKQGDAIFLRPGEPVFDQVQSLVHLRYGDAALRGTVFVDPTSDRAYLFHVAMATVVRRADPGLPPLANEEILEQRLVGLRQDERGQITAIPVEHLLLLRGGENVSAGAYPLAATAEALRAAAKRHLLDATAEGMAQEWRARFLEALPKRTEFLDRGFQLQEGELAELRTQWKQRAENGDAKGKMELERIKEKQRDAANRHEAVMAAARREPDFVAVGDVRFLAHALVVPSSDPEDRKRHDAEVEAIAIRVAMAHEEARGGTPRNVSTAELARAAGLQDYPGFDLVSERLGGEERAIEVKGRAGVGDVEITENEWDRAHNLRGRYWLYVVFDCATPLPRLVRVPDPWGKQIGKPVGGVIVGDEAIFDNGEEDE